MHINLIQQPFMYQQLVSIFINLSRSLEERYAEIADFQRAHGVNQLKKENIGRIYV